MWTEEPGAVVSTKVQMNRIELKRLLLALLVAVSWHSHLDSQGRGSNRATRVEVISGREVAAGEVLVRFKRPVQGPERLLLEEQLDIQQSDELPLNLRRIRSRTFDVQTLRAVLRSHPAVAYAEPNYIVRSAAVPNDPGFTQLWRLLNTGQTINGQQGTPGADIQVERAWDITTGSTDAVVALLDTGVDYTHPDLAGNMWRAPAAFQVTIGESRIVCPAGAYGFNAMTKACDPMDDNNHGTHAAGVIGALGNNVLGITGVNWTTRILPVKFLDATGTGTVADAINALEFLIQTKNAFAASDGANIRVLSNSWGGAQFSQALLDQIERAAANGMLFVAAAGNTSSSSDSFPTYPASYQASNVITVAASDNVDRLASFSDYGSTVHLAAPGVGVLSTTPRNTYGVLSGTSMAAAHVAGAAALILSKCALETPALKAVILESVDALGSLAGWVATSGRLNVDRAIRSCSSAVSGGTLSETPPGAAPPPAAVSAANDTVVTLAIDDAVVNLPFNNAAGTTATDISGNSNHGTLQNGPVWTTGRSNGGLSFDGSNDAVVINSSPSLNSVATSVTVAAWVFRSASQTGWRSIVSRQAGSGSAEHYYLGFNENAFRWVVNTTAGYSNLTIGGPAALGQWLHVVGTYDGTTVRLYVNGVEHFSTPHSGTFAAGTTRVVVGSSHNDAAGTPSEGFNGVIDEMRLYGRALTAQEVNALFVATGTSTNLPPTVTITSPGGGPVSGTVNYTASASDSDGRVLGVHFRIDGVISGVEDTSSPYAADVDTVLYSDGNHTLTAVARDDVGNVTISSPVF
jgi:subtilisin family serine protease